MKVPKLRFRNARLLTALFATSVAAMVSPVTGQSKDHVDLQFWDMIWGGPEYIDAGKALVAQFNQEHPDITVNYRSVPWTNWYQTFLTAIGSGTAPDLSTGAGYQAVQLYDQNAILPIDDLISDWKAKGKLDDFLPNTVDILKYDHHYVALPWAIDSAGYSGEDALSAFTQGKGGAGRKNDGNTRDRNISEAQRCGG
jgi:multiple sugar transport system substrate-binding protein